MGNKVGGDGHQDTQRLSTTVSRVLIRGNREGPFSLSQVEWNQTPMSLCHQSSKAGKVNRAHLTCPAAWPPQQFPLAVTLFLNPGALQGYTVTKFSLFLLAEMPACSSL